jgi:hypothetical protein
VTEENKVPGFDEFVAIDWSGAVRNYDGIAVAKCRPGRSAPSLVNAPGTHWTRSAIVDRLKYELGRGQRLLIGFDFAFGFPYEPDSGYLGGKASGIDDIFSLWSLIEAKSSEDPDFGCMRFVGDADYASLFWLQGSKPKYWVERKRRTEHACAEVTKTRPDTLYKMLHSKQVGKASITGMRVLHHIHKTTTGRVAIWPFEAVCASAIVEIYPTMFRKIAAGTVAKIRSRPELDSALRQIQSEPTRASAYKEFSDHETDALLSAAGLRKIASDPAVWNPLEGRSPRVRREGWIFGVC